jgi:serine/threonine-protein phosphatase 6 regulatory ankyrin repeat subunit B
VQITNQKFQGFLPLHIAAKMGKIAVVKMLLDNGADIDQQTEAPSALYLAAEQGHTSIVELLLTRGANINSAI